MTDCIVHGETVRVAGLTVRSACAEALEATGNTGRPSGDWTAYTPEGRALGADDPAHGTLFVVLRGASGASHTNWRRKNFAGNRPQCGARSTKAVRVRRAPKNKRIRRREMRRSFKACKEINLGPRCRPWPTNPKNPWTGLVGSAWTAPQSGVSIVRDPRWCRDPDCGHILSVYRPGGFKRGTRNAIKGRPNICIVVAADRFRVPVSPSGYVTACGDVLSSGSLSHRAPNCPRCRRTLRKSGIDPDLDLR